MLDIHTDLVQAENGFQHASHFQRALMPHGGAYVDFADGIRCAGLIPVRKIGTILHRVQYTHI